MTTKIDPEVARRERDELIRLEFRLAELSLQAKKLADECGLSRRAIALQMGNLSPSNLQRLLQGMAGKASVETLARFAWACDHDLQVSFVPRSLPDEKSKPEERNTAEAKAVLCASSTKHNDCCDVIDIASRRSEYAANTSRWVRPSEHASSEAPSAALGG